MDVYGTFPSGEGRIPIEYGRRAAEVTRWSDAAGLHGQLIFTDNYSMDPWAGAIFMIAHSTHLVPLVAVQPAYMHPYAAARMVSTITSLHGRRIDLNLVAGGYSPDLKELGQWEEHDGRYERLLAYGRIMAALLDTEEPFSHRSKHYELSESKLVPPLPPEMAPRVFVSGSSPASGAVARNLAATRLSYPEPLTAYADRPDALRGSGVRFGIIARPTSAEAWRLAESRYPVKFTEALRREASASDFDATWHGDQWRHAKRQKRTSTDVYWLRPFRTAFEYCPYLVGSYSEVADVLRGYLDLGISTLILAVPREEDDLHHANEAIRLAEKLRTAA